MTAASGVVSNAGKKVIKGRTYFNFFLENDDSLYRCGSKNPSVEKGDVIEFTYEEDDYGIQVDLSSITKVGTAPKPTAKQAASKSRGGAAGSKDEYWANKEATDLYKQLLISRQASLNTAVSIVDLALKYGELSLGSAKGKKLDVLQTYVFEVAEDVFNHNHENIYDTIYAGITIEDNAATEAATVDKAQGDLDD